MPCALVDFVEAFDGPCIDSFFSGLVALVDGAAQAGAIVMAVIGVARPRQVLRYEPTQAGVAWSIHPGAGSAPVGLTLSLTTL